MEKITKIDQLQKRAEEIRYDIVSMIAETGSGHPGGSLSGVDIGSFYRLARTGTLYLLWYCSIWKNG